MTSSIAWQECRAVLFYGVFFSLCDNNFLTS